VVHFGFLTSDKKSIKKVIKKEEQYIIFRQKKLRRGSSNIRCKERFDRELIVNINYHSYTILAFKRANRAFPVIEPILKKK
jgi:hypothetical protein